MIREDRFDLLRFALHIISELKPGHWPTALAFDESHTISIVDSMVQLLVLYNHVEARGGIQPDLTKFTEEFILYILRIMLGFKYSQDELSEWDPMIYLKFTRRRRFFASGAYFKNYLLVIVFFV